MKKITFDFQVINTKEKLYDHLEKALNLSQYIIGGWGRNLDAFEDAYGYSREAAFLELKNYHSIKDKEFKKYIAVFIETLEDLKKTNPNFDYRILS